MTDDTGEALPEQQPDQQREQQPDQQSEQQSGPQPEAADDSGQARSLVGTAAGVASRRWAMPVLGAVAVLLLAVSGGLGVAYGRADADRAEQRRDLAAQRAERDRLVADLDAARNRQADLTAKLSKLEATALDPAGYKLVKNCVETQARFEQALQKALDEAVRNGKVGSVPNRSVRIEKWTPGTSLPSGAAGDSTCQEALRHLK